MEMAFLRKTITILILLYLQEVYSEEKILNLTYSGKFGDFSGKDVVKSYAIRDNLTYSYALCDHYEGKSQKECILVLHETIQNGDSLEHVVRKCTMRLTFTRYDITVGRKYALTQLDRDNVVFVVESGKRNYRHVKQRRYYVTSPKFYTKYLKVNVVNMSTCESHDTVIAAKGFDDDNVRDQRIETLNIVPKNNGTVDFFFRHDLCGDGYRCKVTYNPHIEPRFSKKVPFLHVFFEPSVKVFPIVSSNSTFMAYAAKTLLYGSGSIVLLNHKGEYVFRDDYSYRRTEIPTRVSNIAISTSQASLGICKQKMRRTALLCSRYDLIGNADVESDITLKSKDVKVLKMQNLEDGGFAVMIGYSGEGDTIIKRLDILKINSKGTLVNLNSVADLKCSSQELNFNVDFYERTGFEYCYYVSCSSLDSSKDYTVTFYTSCQPKIADI